ncbi:MULTISPECIES: YlbF family regulator [Enterococcus]|uniref:Cell fate regulator YmcA, YheA/YmcA/DUF963 family (Controls sporulation, competence, biofilm development) n=1 Tax=Enterococcus durans TaxID=53345 RepID=A0A367CJ03_9ENTE|nr:MULTISPECIES: YlbF family regulator [Enterococcus]MDB1678181.1 YlbF family regulator [Enterococcus durans]RCA12020.1 hypothetical protein EA71_00224 [Enterococcus durans]
MPKEANIQKEADKLMEQLSLNEVIIRYKELEMKVQQNHYLTQLTEEIQKAQKEAVNFAHYGKKEAEKEAIARANELTKTMDQHPLVLAYRHQLVEANDLLQHLTKMIQEEINEWIEEEEHASKN